MSGQIHPPTPPGSSGRTTVPKAPIPAHPAVVGLWLPGPASFYPFYREGNRGTQLLHKVVTEASFQLDLRLPQVPGSGHLFTNRFECWLLPCSGGVGTLPWRALQPQNTTGRMRSKVWAELLMDCAALFLGGQAEFTQSV